ncbi:MAG: Recombination protein RecR [Myxococcota bacterium]|nr:Recombination protein RecR [Myxococcota bacterium]
MADPIQQLTAALARLPGVGEKTAQRFVFFLLADRTGAAREIAHALARLADEMSLCRQCGFPSQGELCAYCSDPRRDGGLICVVQNPQDVLAIERTAEYRGRYHVLHGVINPLEGVGPDRLPIRELLARLDGVSEVILALNPTVEGDATALYLQRLISPAGVKVTRPATGVAVGMGIEYADKATLAQAINSRRGMG